MLKTSVERVTLCKTIDTNKESLNVLKVSVIEAKKDVKKAFVKRIRKLTKTFAYSYNICAIALIIKEAVQAIFADRKVKDEIYLDYLIVENEIIDMYDRIMVVIVHRIRTVKSTDTKKAEIVENVIIPDSFLLIAIVFYVDVRRNYFTHAYEVGRNLEN